MDRATMTRSHLRGPTGTDLAVGPGRFCSYTQSMATKMIGIKTDVYERLAAEKREDER